MSTDIREHEALLHHHLPLHMGTVVAADPCLRIAATVHFAATDFTMAAARTVFIFLYMFSSDPLNLDEQHN